MNKRMAFTFKKTEAKIPRGFKKGTWSLKRFPYLFSHGHRSAVLISLSARRANKAQEKPELLGVVVQHVGGRGRRILSWRLV
jgi:hypothetical protein